LPVKLRETNTVSRKSYDSNVGRESVLLSLIVPLGNPLVRADCVEVFEEKLARFVILSLKLSQVKFYSLVRTKLTFNF